MSREDTTPARGPVRDLYHLVTGDAHARVCQDISDAACREPATHFFIHRSSSTGSLPANKAGDLVTRPKTGL